MPLDVARDRPVAEPPILKVGMWSKYSPDRGFTVEPWSPNHNREVLFKFFGYDGQLADAIIGTAELRELGHLFLDLADQVDVTAEDG